MTELLSPTPLAQVDLFAWLKDLQGEAETEHTRLKRFDDYLRGKHDKPVFSQTSQMTLGRIWQDSTVNLCPLATDTVAQRLSVDGFRPSIDSDNGDLTWGLWQASGMDKHQSLLYSSVATYGYAYASALPAAGIAPVRLRAWSPRSVYAVYADPFDPFPSALYRASSCGSGNCTVVLWTPDFVYTVERNAMGAMTLISTVPNELGVVPFVKYSNQESLDDDNAPLGEIEPLISLQNQLNTLTFIINLIGERTSFTIKYILGLEFDKDEDGNIVSPPWQNLPGEIWAMGNNGQGKNPEVGQFTPDNPGSLIAYRDKIKGELYTAAQIPPHYADQSISNVSAEALVAAETSLQKKIGQRRLSLGESHENLLRLGASIAGYDDIAQDLSAQMHWADTSPRSLAQVVDAAGKAILFGVPQEVVWTWLPDVSQQDVEQWKSLNQRTQGQAQLDAIIEAGQKDFGSGS